MSELSLDNIGVIAGNGIYPETFVAAARKAGMKRVTVAAFENETKPELAKIVDSVEWFRVGQMGKMLAYFVREGVTQAVMVGQIAPKNLFDLRPDFRTLMVLAKLKERNAETLFGAVANEMLKDGITLLPATTFLEDLIPETGTILGPKLKRRR